MGIERHNKLECDILVAGGGAAGVPCALAAARNGAKVILCQDRPVLGGNSSSEIRLSIAGADACGKRGIPLKIEAREGGILEEIRLESAYRNAQRSATMWDLIMYEKCYEEPNLKLMLNTVVDGTELSDSFIVAAHATRASTEDKFSITAKTFIDCTGDGRLGAEAGAQYSEGREASSTFGESRAVKTADGYRLGSSLLFMARDMGHPVPFLPPKFARKFSEDDLKLRSHKHLEYGYWWIEWGGTMDTIRDNEQIKHELLAILMGVWDHIKNGGDHGADNWALTWFGFVPGKRESRRFFGQYRLKQTDIEEAINFPDTIAYGGWALDTHPPQGIDALGVHPGTDALSEYTEHLYSIPLRACVSVNIHNLMFAGRNISASHIAFSSTRIMATCAVIGQGVGTAAVLGITNGIIPLDMANDQKFMESVQQQLLLDDCFIPGVSNTDSRDMARNAHITASSYQEKGSPANIISGETRAVFGKNGVKSGMTIKGTHRWMSDPAAGFPAWINLEWMQPVEIGFIQIIFDTGMHRALTQSHAADFYGSKMHWGPQPETVKNYRLLYSGENGKMIELAIERNNYQRRRIHSFKPVHMKQLRFIAEAAWGLDHAHVIEIRCYLR